LSPSSLRDKYLTENRISKILTLLSKRHQRKFIQYKESTKFKQIFRPSYKASRNGSSRDVNSRSRSAVTGVQIANGTICGSACRAVTKLSLQCYNVSVRKYQGCSVCVEVIQNNLTINISKATAISFSAQV
jgi:hypothetical protein